MQPWNSRLKRVTTRMWRPTLVAAWCALIFMASAQPDLRVADSALLDTVLRKAAHMFVYGVLALLVSMTLRQEGASARAAVTWSWALTLVYAVSDEWHQTFVHGRSGRLADVGIDAVGATLGLGVAGLLVARGRRPAAHAVTTSSTTTSADDGGGEREARRTLAGHGTSNRGAPR